MRLSTILSATAATLLVTSAQAQLRIVDYNTAGGPRTGLDAVLESISDELLNGFSKPIDVLSLQEQDSSATTTQDIVDLLNGIYGSKTYNRATLDGATSGAGRPGLIYNTSTVSLIDQLAFGTVNTSAQARQTLRYQLRPVGYDESADFYVYSNHYKAGSSGTDKVRRQIEAAALRANADALGEGTHAIYSGDYNIRSSYEQSYQTLQASGNGQAFDPISTPGTWHDSSSFKAVHSQAPAISPSGLIGGGVDDRFDFQLVTGEFLDGEGLSYLSGSYHTFGNNGTHSLNGDISSGSGASPSVLAALETASDHLPIVADYQLPASMNVLLGTIPKTVGLGEIVDIGVTIENIANVITAIGADELDYDLSVSGDLIGGASGIAFPLTRGNIHQIMLDTTTAGIKNGILTVMSTSQAVANGLFSFPISFDVLGNADFDDDGDVDGRDFLVWQQDGGNMQDLAVWQQQFGTNAFNVVAVPEPASIEDLVIILVLVFAVHISRQDVNRKWRRFKELR